MRHDVVMVGAGLVGLSTVRALRRLRPGLRVAVVEKEAGPARHQSGHSSGVLHAGLYYTPGSGRARLCVSGKRQLEAYADEHAIPVLRCGKVVVAVEDSELGRLDVLARRGEANGVPGLRMLSPAELREVEPHAAGLRALHSPGTSVVDFARVAEALAGELAAGEVELRYGAEVVSARRSGGETVLGTTSGELSTRFLVSCAGLQSDRVARLTGPVEPRVLPFRGDYYTLEPVARALVRGLVYPVPDPALPFLGVHLTRRVDGAVWAGPNAVPATAREGYRRTDLRMEDVAEALRFPGSWRLAGRYWRTGVLEAWRDASTSAFARQVQRYLPELRTDQLVRGPSGVRAQAVRPDGTLVDDFLLTRHPGALHVLNAPSPAATACLAIGEHLAPLVLEQLDAG